MYLAHSRNPHGEPQELAAHLLSVAETAASMGSAFDASDLCRFLGLWHDAGKFSDAFQAYLAACDAGAARRTDRVDHKAAGAAMVARTHGLLALPIQGHHGGLKDPLSDLKPWLADRGRDPNVGQAIARTLAAIPEASAAEASARLPHHVTVDPLAAELFVRMVFSALVDADFLDTERHFRSGSPALRGSAVTMASLWERLRSHHARLPLTTSPAVADARRRVYEACLASADQPPGIFRLTVPTGGGKTLSGMAFAIRHALKHGLRRIIVAVPFISITEQTADVYRDVFSAGIDGVPVVLEHHSAAFGSDGDDYEPEREWHRFAAENWDAPVVVTTTVQLFESLFSASTSSCRKLHNLARSVLILDEAQSLPSHLLQPILDVLKELSSRYGTTVVISTATQPAFDAIPVFKDVPAREIVPESASLFSALRRVTYEWKTDAPVSWQQVAEQMADATQILAVVNTKKDALALLDELHDPGALHLSTLLCGAHRRKVLAEARRRLAAGEPCRLVSTQVVEAGVDFDFPVVLRSLGPLDSVIQAAGRCNREGRLAAGRVVIFKPEEGGMPKGPYRTAAGITAALLGDSNPDPNDPEVSRSYFESLFKTVETDREHIQALRARLNFPATASKFRMVDDDTESVVIMSYCAAPDARDRTAELRGLRGAVDRLRNGDADARRLLRQIQPYLVNVRRREVEKLVREGIISPVMPGLGEWTDEYDPVRGIGGARLEPESLVF